MQFYVYLLKIDYQIKENAVGTIYKIGMSTNTEKRMNSFRNPDKPSSEVKGRGIKIKSITKLNELTYQNETTALAVEARFLKLNEDIRYPGKLLPNGNSEIFSSLPRFGKGY